MPPAASDKKVLRLNTTPPWIDLPSILSNPDIPWCRRLLPYYWFCQAAKMAVHAGAADCRNMMSPLAFVALLVFELSVRFTASLYGATLRTQSHTSPGVREGHWRRFWHVRCTSACPPLATEERTFRIGSVVPIAPLATNSLNHLA